LTYSPTAECFRAPERQTRLGTREPRSSQLRTTAFDEEPVPLGWQPPHRATYLSEAGYTATHPMMSHWTDLLPAYPIFASITTSDCLDNRPEGRQPDADGGQRLPPVTPKPKSPGAHNNGQHPLLEEAGRRTDPAFCVAF